MRRIPRLVATSAAITLSALGASPLAASPRTPGARAAATPPAASVTRVSVVPANGRAEVVIGIDSSVTFRDFTLGSPSRVVVDLNGARLESAPRFYDRVARGGITNLRVAQYKPDVVRIVVELDSLRRYEITREGGDLRISVAGAVGEFAAWHSGPAASAVAARPEVRERAPERAPEAAPAAPVAETEARVTAQTEHRRPMSGETPTFAQSQQPRITVTYQDADIRDVLAAFAAFSGRTIVVGPQVTGTVTAEIRDQPWDVALRAILQAQGLSATEDPSGIITVDTYRNIASRQSSEPLETRLIALNYARATSLQETVRQLLSRDCPPGDAPAPAGQAAAGGGSCAARGAVGVDTATNTLLITEVPSRMGDILGYVQALDVRTPQVAIKAKIIFVSRTDIEELGVTYDLGSTRGFSNRLVQRTNPLNNTPFGPDVQVIQLGGDALIGLANAGRRFQPTAALNLIYSTAIGNYTLTSFLDALQEIRLADTQAEPNIVTLDNRAASILVGEETPIRVIDAAGGGGTSARANVTFKESGIRLDVTPHITNNRQIMMTLHAEQSQLQAAAADIGFTFLKRRADSQVLVNDGETAVFGGLTLTQVTTSKSGIPFLVDLPLIGRLFGETRTQEAKQDMLVLVTPHIIDEGETPRIQGGPR
jgi:type IV pilus assembly protein PilQ